VKQILVVDDSAVVRKVARRILENMHFRTSEAPSGVAALAVCERAMPDVILLDWQMPEMDGLEFLGALRKMPGGVSPKVLYCTIENEVGHLARAKHAGADDYLMQPFDTETMRRKFADIGLL
jgi:two-component system chemotaxis response regulator CheY